MPTAGRDRTTKSRRRAQGVRRPHRIARACTLAAASGITLVAAPLRGQAVDHRDGHAVSRDSAASVHAAARSAQAAFERRRRWLLPAADGAAGRCDVQIGRWCYWYDLVEPLVPSEPASIVRERLALLATLERLSVASPADVWIVGQRVRYLDEAGQHAAAAATARACAGDASWCAALLGFALHRGGDAVAAERAFDAALGAMPPDSACRWLDPRPVVPREHRAAFPTACTTSDTLAAHFWWRATPFLTRGANDRRSEHLARQVLARLFADARTTYGDRWTGDLYELLLRYGWPDRWTRRPATQASVASVEVVGHEPWPSYRFTPDASLRAADDRTAPSVHDPRAAERAASPVARHVVELDVVAAAFHRADSMRVVAVASVPDTLLVRPDSVSLAVASFRGSMTVTRAPVGDGPVVATATGAVARLLVGIEATNDTVVAIRGRTSADPPLLDRGFGVSDLLLFAVRSPTQPMSTLDDVSRSALPRAVTAGDTIGLYWEVYGLSDGAQSVSAMLYVESPRPGWLARAAARVTGRVPTSPPRLRWTDVGAGGVIAARTLVLDGGVLSPGRHDLVLGIRHPDGRTAVARRTVEVRAR